MCACSVVTSAASIACASLRCWITRSRPALNWSGSALSMMAILHAVPAKRLDVSIDDRRLSLSNLDKLLYPQAGFTKGHVIDYYTRIAPILLPHLRDRPLTLKRYPDGVEKGHFYEKRCPSHRPEWVRTAPVWSGRNEGDINYCVADALATLVWLANLAALEMHTPLARASDI